MKWILLLFTVVQLTAQPLTRDQEIVAITIIKEAIGEGKEGMYAVACVIKQRSIERNKSCSAVCLEPKQFSVWNKSTYTKNKSCLFPENDLILYAKQLSIHIDNVDRSRVRYANGFYSGKKPKWLPNKSIVKKVRNHTFWKL